MAVFELAPFCSCAVPLAATVRSIVRQFVDNLPHVTWRNFFVNSAKFYFFSAFRNIFKQLQAIPMNPGKCLKNIYAEMFMYARPLNHILRSHKLCHIPYLIGLTLNKRLWLVLTRCSSG